jgi:hypothetical protein
VGLVVEADDGRDLGRPLAVHAPRNGVDKIVKGAHLHP